MPCESLVLWYLLPLGRQAVYREDLVLLCLALGQGALRELSLAVPKYYTVSNNNNYLYSVSNNLSFGVLFWSKDINFSPAIPATAFVLFSA